MNKKQSLIYIGILLFINLSYAAETFNLFPQNTQSIYAYDGDNPPDICFFPKDKAFWDGSKITAVEWRMLTDYQKASFISEYIKLLEKEHKTFIDYDGFKFLKDMNEIVDDSNDDTDQSWPVTEIIDSFLLKRHYSK